MARRTAKTAAPDARKAAIEKIAFSKLGMSTLEARNMDSLDFYDLGVWNIREALEAAYEAGRKAK